MKTHALFVPLLLLPRLGASAEVHFTDITEDAGITFVHENGATGKKYLPETMGSGVAFFDFDGDGDQDLLFVNSMSWPRGPTTSALYRNRGDGAFEDVTAGSGLDRAVYGMGVAVGDYDGDGDRDVYVTALGTNLLFRNDGGATFTEVGKDAGVDHDGFGSSATWLDYDKDGDLDLFVLNYVQWSIEKDIFCALDGKNKSYCTPESYEGASAVLYRNDGEGKFTDVTKASGLDNPRGKGLGAAVFDFDLDGWLDIAVANDTQPNYLYRNKGGGTFEDIGVLSGIAFAENGAARGAMGIDASDYDASGRQSLVIGNFSNEMLSLYHNEGRGFFIDQAPVSEIGRASLVTLSFASFFFDYDLDGREDIFVANGHVESDIHNVQQRVSYAQPPHLFKNEGNGRFPRSHRGDGRKLRPSDGRARRGLWRYRWRRRSGPRGHDERRAAAAVPQRWRELEQLDRVPPSRHKVQPGSHRGVRAGDRFRAHGDADGQERFWLLLPEPARRHRWARRCRKGRQGRDLLAVGYHANHRRAGIETYPRDLGTVARLRFEVFSDTSRASWNYACFRETSRFCRRLPRAAQRRSAWRLRPAGNPF